MRHLSDPFQLRRHTRRHHRSPTVTVSPAGRDPRRGQKARINMTTLTLCLQPKSSRFCKEYRCFYWRSVSGNAWFAAPDRPPFSDPGHASRCVQERVQIIAKLLGWRSAWLDSCGLCCRSWPRKKHASSSLSLVNSIIAPSSRTFGIDLKSTH
jgi:hypothetical protein